MRHVDVQSKSPCNALWDEMLGGSEQWEAATYSTPSQSMPGTLEVASTRLEGAPSLRSSEAT